MIEHGIVFKGTGMVIPLMKCKAVLKQIHEGHLGLNKGKLQAKDTVYLARTHTVSASRNLACL